MKGKRIIRASKALKSRTNWAKIDATKDDEIDYSDAPATDAEFWSSAQIVMPEPKVALGVRFDRDVVDWFKDQGSGYQTRMNAVLRAYMESQKSPRKKVSG